MQKLGGIFLLEMIPDWFKNIVPLKKFACGSLFLRPGRPSHRQKYHVQNWTSKFSEIMGGEGWANCLKLVNPKFWKIEVACCTPFEMKGVTRRPFSWHVMKFIWIVYGIFEKKMQNFKLLKLTLHKNLEMELSNFCN